MDDAIDRLPDVAREILKNAREFGLSSPLQEALYNEMTAVLDAAPDRRQEQLNASTELLRAEISRASDETLAAVLDATLEEIAGAQLQILHRSLAELRSELREIRDDLTRIKCRME